MTFSCAALAIVLGPMADNGSLSSSSFAIVARTNGATWLTILPDDAEIAAAIRASGAGVEHAALAHRAFGDARTAARSGHSGVGRCGSPLGDLLRSDRSLVALGHGDLKGLERQLELRDLALDLLGAWSEPLALELRDPRLQNLHQQLLRPQRRRHPLDFDGHPGVLDRERGDHRAQFGRVGW